MDIYTAMPATPRLPGRRREDQDVALRNILVILNSRSRSLLTPPIAGIFATRYPIHYILVPLFV